MRARFILPLILLALCAPAWAQIPRINTFYPIGGKAGSTVDLEIRGSSLEGANLLMVNGQGVTGTVGLAASKANEQFRPLWENKCGSCHELRSPSNRSMTPDQWSATVDRMIKVRQAPISAPEAQNIKQYLMDAAKSGILKATVKIAPGTLPGLCELRLVTPRGISTAALFEVGNLTEYMAADNTRNTPLNVTLPCVVNGSINQAKSGGAERHFFRFQAKSGQRLVFNLKGYRYNFLTQLYFNPNLRLYDSGGKQIVENHGYYDLDPLIDWTCPADGFYTLEVRDLLGRGNPGNVYRMMMGALPYDTAVYPPAAQAGSNAALNVIGKNTEAIKTSYTASMPTETGVQQIGSPCGPEPIYVSAYAVVKKEDKPAGPTALPAGFAGRITHPGEADTFTVQGEGVYEFEAYVGRVGSTGNLRFTLLNGNGQGVAGMGSDGRMTAKLDAGKPYTLKVESADGQYSPTEIYAVEARPAHPVVECVVRPANITLRPGLSTAVEVDLIRREGVEGDVIVSADGLPYGVVSSANVIQPDRNSTYIILTALASTKPLEKAIHIMVTAKGPMGEVKTEAQPQELFNLNNQLTPVNRKDCVLAVRGQADFTAEVVSPQVIKVHPRKGVEVKVKITRKPNFKGNVVVFLKGLPLGWVANPEAADANKTEVTLLVRPDGNNTQPFLTRDPKMTPIYATVEAGTDEFQFVYGTILVGKADKIDDKSDN